MMDEYYKNFYENAPIGFFTFCKNSGQFVRANSEMMSMLGISGNELLETSFFSLLGNPEQKENLVLMLENDSAKDLELPMKLSGDIRWFLINARYCEGKFCPGHPETCKRCEAVSCPLRMTETHEPEQCDGFKCIEGSAIDMTIKKSMEGIIQQTKEEDTVILRQIQQDIEKRIQDFDKGQPFKV